jgi:HSP20 family molecular chaperone IbpA
MKHAASKKSRTADIRFIVDNTDRYEEYSSFSELIHWQPLYNLYATDDSIVVHIELTGVNLQEIVIFLRSRYMFIAGNRLAPPGVIEEHCVFHNLEIPYGRFARRIDFPVPVETRQYRYETRDGILTIRLKAVAEKIIPVEGT